jgi:hypothetical protein
VGLACREELRERKIRRSTRTYKDLAIRSALLSLPSIVLIVAQKSSGWTMGGGRENEGMCGEAGGGVEHGLSNRSGVENVGDRSGVSTHLTVGVPHV